MEDPMSHAIRWTAEKIARRLQLIEPLAHRRRAPLAPFRYRALDGPLQAPPVAIEVDDADWLRIGPDDYWGAWRQDFVLRTHFQVPEAWTDAGPLALYLPLGAAGDFSHPEALVYVDGEPFAACDRHHQEVQLD